MRRTQRYSASALGLALAIGVTTIGGSVLAADERPWFRGQLHAHTYWSDGKEFPEQVVAVCKERGYDFLALTDHNRFEDNPTEWRVVGATGQSKGIPRAAFDSYVKAYGADWANTKSNASSVSVRLKTYAEVRARFEEAAKFVLLPGVELTQDLNGLAVHLNYVNSVQTAWTQPYAADGGG
jgi:hypothetical protein